jgi:ABC-type transport system involved in cytochrome c biogenesis permease subunit
MTFIYYIDRGFLRYTLRNPIAKFLSKMMPVLGAGQAILFCQSPELFLVPVVSVGALMAALLIWGAIDGSFVGRIAKESRQWGLRTLFNMVFAATLMLVTALVLWQEPGARAFWNHVGSVISNSLAIHVPSTGSDLIVYWMYFVNLVMIYFWWHIRPEQQSAIALAASLALHDRTHIEGRKT